MTGAHSILTRRRAGILLHITSLPGGIGNGDFGVDAYRFVDFLAECELSVWQTLPINQPGEGISPYDCLSAFAGNPLLINLEWLRERGWLSEIAQEKTEIAADYRLACLRKAFESFKQLSTDDPYRQFSVEFAENNSSWLMDFSLFMALREENKHRPWQEWPIPLRDREPEAMRAARMRLADEMAYIEFEQFVFFQQWHELREYARRRGVVLFGDMPIFVAWHGADVWACREYFDLTPEGYPRVVAGVPPDYFSATGQRWGNPLYNWPQMAADGFSWWVARLRTQLNLYDWVRIDHFRGLEAYWEIPADSDSAVNGHWVKAPGAELLETFFGTFGREELPLVAENLGIITPEVEALRHRFDIPGMAILQFAFDGSPSNPYLPGNQTANTVVYTGTHDNDTTLSWYESLSDEVKQQVYAELGNPELPMPLALVQCALDSVAQLVILPMQDVLELGTGNRMNTPGTVGDHNWTWRFDWDQLTADKVDRLEALVKSSGRDF